MRLKKKATLGRQKIPMAKIEKKSNLAVTFSKRRVGLLNKASELSTICGAEIAIIGFTPAKKPFSFGHLNVETVVDRFLLGNTVSLPPRELDAYCKKLRDLNMELTKALSGLEDEKKKKRDREMEQIGKESVRMSMIKGWEKPIEEMNMSETQEMKHELEALAKEHREHMAYLCILGQQRNNSLLAYGYAQAGQGYQQDGYGAYNVSQQSGYVQAIGYDQQVGHDSTTNPSQEEDTFKATLALLAQFRLARHGTSGQHLPAQGSTSQIGYGFAPSSQVGNSSQPPIAYNFGYGAPPPTSNTQVYGQNQQLPGAPESYGSQFGYAQSAVSGYGQAPQAYGFYGGYTHPDAGGGTPGL